MKYYDLIAGLKDVHSITQITITVKLIFATFKTLGRDIKKEDLMIQQRINITKIQIREQTREGYIM